jgi:hypothetical protein
VISKLLPGRFTVQYMRAQRPSVAPVPGTGYRYTGIQCVINFSENSSTVPLSQVAALQGRQLGRSLAGVLSGAAANLRSRLAGIADGGSGRGASGPRGSPSPPLNKKEDLVSQKSPPPFTFTILVA